MRTQLFVDDGMELLESQPAGKETAVNEVARRSVKLKVLPPFVQLRFDHRGLLTRIQTLVELLSVKLQRPGILLESCNVRAAY